MRILVGHKGIGKSALFKVAMQEQRERAELPVLIRPDDIVGLEADHKDFLGTIRHWKKGLQEIIAEKVLETLGLAKPGSMEGVLSQTGKLLNFLRQTLSPYLESKVSAKAAQVALIKSFLDKKAITVYDDDVDRGWDGSRDNIARASALLNALKDLCNDNMGLKFKLSLRSDVYFLVRKSDESTGKVEGSVVWVTWSNHEILALLVKRVETFYERQADEQSLLQMAIELGRFTFSNGAEAGPKDLAQFLYKINFLTARKELPSGEIDRKYFEENRYLSARFADFGYDWEIHPAYRWALQRDSIKDVYDRLSLSRDTD